MYVQSPEDVVHYSIDNLSCDFSFFLEQLKDNIKPDVNRIWVFLGNGWYKGRFGYLEKWMLREYYGDCFLLLADLFLTGMDGTNRVLGTDVIWLALKSTVITSGIYDGEMYDARMEAALETIPKRQVRYAVKA